LPRIVYIPTAQTTLSKELPGELLLGIGCVGFDLDGIDLGKQQRVSWVVVFTVFTVFKGGDGGVRTKAVVLHACVALCEIYESTPYRAEI
jgi:hypothetical protein